MQIEIKNPFELLKEQIHSDPEYAWAWHCKLAMSIKDSIKVSHSTANKTGADLMSYLFEYDIRKHPSFSDEKPNTDVFHDVAVILESSSNRE